MKINRTTLFSLIGFSVAVLFVFYQFLLQISPSVMYSSLEHDFHLGPEALSVLTSSFFYTYLIAQIPAGLCVDRFGARRVLLCGIFLAVLSTLFFSLSKQLHWLYYNRILSGLATAPAVVAAMSIASCRFDSKWFGVFAGMTEMMGMLGGALGDLLLSHSVKAYGWRTTLWLTAIAGFLLLFIALLFLCDSSRPQNVVSRRPKFQLLQLGSLLKRPQMWLNGLYAGLMFVAISAFAGLWLIPFVETIYPMHLLLAAKLASVLFVGAALGGPWWGWLVELTGWFKQLMLLASIASCILLVLFLLYPSMPMGFLYVDLALLGFFSAIYVLPFVIVRKQIRPESRGVALGFVNMMCILIGAPVVQPLIGWMLQRSATTQLAGPKAVYDLSYYVHVLWILPVCCLLAALLVGLIRVDSSLGWRCEG